MARKPRRDLAGTPTIETGQLPLGPTLTNGCCGFNRAPRTAGSGAFLTLIGRSVNAQNCPILAIRDSRRDRLIGWKCVTPDLPRPEVRML
jgi:hypothetical protein